MARVKIRDLDMNVKVSKEDIKRIKGGYSTSGSLLASQFLKIDSSFIKINTYDSFLKIG